MPTMSIQDVNAYHNANSGGITSYAKSAEDVDNIFEEIEQLLNHNDSLEISVKAPTTNTPKKQLKNSQPISTCDTDYVNLDFLPECNNQAFLISSDTQTLPEEEPSLYSVNQNELQPVNAPFMVPGIYKKIANAPVAANDITAQMAIGDPTNVFFITKRAKGKIISLNDFENYSSAEEQNEQFECDLKDSRAADVTESSAESASDALLKFACNVYKSAPNDQLEIHRSKNEITRTHSVTKRKIIYRLLGPKDISLQAGTCVTSSKSIRKDIRSLKLKKGRPKKRRESTEKAQPILHKKSKVETNPKIAEAKPLVNKVEQSVIRTRSGRVVKSLAPQTTSTSVTNEPPALELPNDLFNELKDKDFRDYPENHSMHMVKDNLPLSASSSVPLNKRRVPPESICPKCGKIFLGRRLKRHFTQHPDHMLAGITSDQAGHELQQQINIEGANEEMTLFHFLISKLQRPILNEDQRADLFLNELNDLVEQLQLRSTRLIRNTSGLHFVSARTARVLGIPEGQYALDMSAIDSEMPFMDTDHQSFNNEEPKRQPMIAVNVSTPSLDYAAISLDNTLTDEAAQKLNLSAGGKLLPPSEESLLRGVDDLVHDGITKLVSANLLQPPRSVVQSSVASSLVSSHYDHVSDNAVEALTIKENNRPQNGAPLLDFFQFKNN